MSRSPAENSSQQENAARNLTVELWNLGCCDRTHLGAVDAVRCCDEASTLEPLELGLL